MFILTLTISLLLISPTLLIDLGEATKSNHIFDFMMIPHNKNTTSDLFVAEKLTPLLWKNLVSYYGHTKALNVMPPTYDLPNDTDLLVKYMKVSRHPIVLTNNTHRILTRDWRHVNQDHVMAQEFIPHNYLYRGYRVILRYYFLVISQNGGEQSFWIHPHAIIANTNASDPITSVCNCDFPYIVEDFYGKIGMKNSEKLWGQVRGLARMLALAVREYCYNLGHSNFGLFGMDFAVDQDFQPRLIEVDRVPGNRTTWLRKRVYLDVLNMLGIIPDNDENEFRLLAFT